MAKDQDTLIEQSPHVNVLKNTSCFGEHDDATVFVFSAFLYCKTGPQKWFRF